MDTKVLVVVLPAKFHANVGFAALPRDRMKETARAWGWAARGWTPIDGPHALCLPHAPAMDFDAFKLSLFPNHKAFLKPWRRYASVVDMLPPTTIDGRRVEYEWHVLAASREGPPTRTPLLFGPSVDWYVRAGIGADVVFAHVASVDLAGDAVLPVRLLVYYIHNWTRMSFAFPTLNFVGMSEAQAAAAFAARPPPLPDAPVGTEAAVTFLEFSTGSLSDARPRARRAVVFVSRGPSPEHRTVVAPAKPDGAWVPLYTLD